MLTHGSAFSLSRIRVYYLYGFCRGAMTAAERGGSWWLLRDSRWRDVDAKR